MLQTFPPQTPTTPVKEHLKSENDFLLKSVEFIMKLGGILTQVDPDLLLLLQREETWGQA